MMQLRKECKHFVQCCMLLLVTSLGLLGASSCSEEEVPAEVIPNPDSEIYFQSCVNFTSSGGESVISFTTNKDWSIDILQSGGEIDWCTVSPMQGKAGENTIRIRTAENSSYDERNATLTLTAKEVSKKIVVTQKQKDAITLTTSKYEVERKGGTIQVKVKANVSYTVEIPEQYRSWIQQTKAATRGLSTSVLHFAISKSEEYDKREGEIIIRSGELSETLKIYQAGEGILLLSQNEYPVSSAGEQIKVELSSNFDYEVKMPQVDWITRSTTRGIPTHTLYYTVAANTTYDSRKAEIIYYDRNNKALADTLKIVQAATISLNIHLDKEGDLANVIKKMNINYLEINRLTITGKITNPDIKLIREMAGSDERGLKTEGSLAYLDLSDAQIVTSSENDYYFINTGYDKPIDKEYDIFYRCSTNEIGTHMFYNCDALRELILPRSTVELLASAFQDCDNLEHIQLFEGIVRTAGTHCFADCKSLKEISLPNSMKSLSPDTFSGCISLEHVKLPETIVYLNDGLFSDCLSLKDITIPESVGSIGSGVFSYCSSLKSIILPDNVTSIGDHINLDYIFSFCTSLEEVVLGPKLQCYAFFQGCTNIKEIHCKALDSNLPTCYFEDNVYEDATVYVPKGCYETYRVNHPWQHFKNIVEE